MNCPKCGYAQEDRLDCIKCGIVFSKYYALHLPERTPPEAPEPRITLPPLPDMGSAGISELRQTVQELNRRFMDVEFERAERNQIRAEIRSLDQTLRELAGQLNTRLTESEARINDLRGPAAEPPIEVIKEQLWKEDLEPLMEKLEQLEESIEMLQERQQSPQEDRQAAETVRDLDKRLTELEARTSGLDRDKPTDEDGRLAAVEQALKELPDLKVSVQMATVRYSEIGDLKKTNLVLQNHMDSIRHELESLRKEPSNGVEAKVAELQAEMVALRAEVQQSWKQLQALQTTSPGGNGIRELKDEVAGIKKLRSDEAEKIRQAVSGASERIGSLSTQLQSMAGELKRVDRELASSQVDYRALSERLSSLETTSDFPRPPLEEDVHAIREHLADIRRFVGILQKVPTD